MLTTTVDALANGLVVFNIIGGLIHRGLPTVLLLHDTIEIDGSPPWETEVNYVPLITEAYWGSRGNEERERRVLSTPHIELESELGFRLNHRVTTIPTPEGQCPKKRGPGRPSPVH